MLISFVPFLDRLAFLNKLYKLYWLIKLTKSKEGNVQGDIEDLKLSSEKEQLILALFLYKLLIKYLFIILFLLSSSHKLSNLSRLKFPLLSNSKSDSSNWVFLMISLTLTLLEPIER